MIFDSPTISQYDTFHDFFVTHRGGTFPFLVWVQSFFEFTDHEMTGTVDGINDTFGLVYNFDTGTQTFAKKIKYAEATSGSIFGADGTTIRKAYSGWSFKENTTSNPLTVSSSTLDQITFTTPPGVGTGQPLATVGMFRLPMVFMNRELPARLEGPGRGSVRQIELMEELIR